jgi:monothiol glutaredoxin
MEVMERIQKQVDSAAIVLYMKGTPQFPQCGFSATAAKTLASTGVEFAYVNIFEDQEVFQNLPSFADWPTFPQIYMNSELVGGGDIINSAYKQQHCYQSYSNCLPIIHWCYPMAITPMTKIQ